MGSGDNGARLRPLAPLKDLIEDFLLIKSNLNTRSTYRKALFSFFGENDSSEALREVEWTNLALHRDKLLKDGKSNSTVATQLTALRRFFSFLVSQKYLEKNPGDSDLVESPLVSKESKANALVEDEYELLLETIPTETEAGRRDKAIVAIALFAGLRRSEIAKLTVGDMVQEGELWIFKVRRGKRKELRTVVIHPRAVGIVQEYLRRRVPEPTDSSPLVASFSNRSGPRKGFMNPATINEIIKAWVGRLRIKRRITAHSFRHTCTTELLRNGAPIDGVKEQLGHESIDTTLRYKHKVDKMQNPAISYWKPKARS